MKLIYLATARTPDDWAHTIQILKMCEAFATHGTEVELVVPWLEHSEESAQRATQALKDVKHYTWENRAKNILAFSVS